METLAFFIGLIAAYFLGAIPTAVWFGKQFFGIDVRDHGSGNPGATNTFRTIGKQAGTIVLLIDVVKGLSAASLAVVLMKMGYLSDEKLVLIKILYGITAVFGHIFTVFLYFKGGKGVATLLGMMLSIHYEVALICVCIFLVTLISSKYVSLGSILSALAFPTLLLFVPRFKTSEPALLIFSFFIFLVVLWTHHKNIRRLSKGEENKTYLIKSKDH